VWVFVCGSARRAIYTATTNTTNGFVWLLASFSLHSFAAYVFASVQYLIQFRLGLKKNNGHWRARAAISN
jgi:hypothetical protein